MPSRHLLGLLIVALALVPAVADAPDKEQKPPEEKKPTAGQIAAALQELEGRDPERLGDRFDALELLERARAPRCVPEIFQSALTTQLGAYAFRAGEVANKLDAKQALRTYDTGRKKRDAGFRGSNAVRFLSEIRAPGVSDRLYPLRR